MMIYNKVDNSSGLSGGNRQEGGTVKTCLRCGTAKHLSAIGGALFNFVCDDCRKDGQIWEWKGREGSISVTIEEMEKESPELPSRVKAAMKGQLPWIIDKTRTPRSQQVIRNQRIYWGDGKQDNSNKCDMCLAPNCPFPVHREYYREKSKKAVV